MITRKNIIEEARLLGFSVFPDEEIKPGDFYVAKRNTAIELFEAKFIGYSLIFSKEMDYPFNLDECVKVTLE